MNEREYERISSLVKKVKKEKFPELRKIKIIEKDDFSSAFEGAMAALKNQIYYLSQITCFMPDDSLEGAIGHELSHIFLKHSYTNPEKYWNDKEFTKKVEKEADDEVKKRGLEKELQLFYVLDTIWWSKLEVTEADIETARRKIYK